MREKATGGLTVIALALAGMIVLGALPVSASVPAPVIKVDEQPRPQDGGESDGDQPPDDEQPDDGCLLGSPRASAARGGVAFEGVGIGRLVAYPGPVVAVQQQRSDCITQLSLSLVVESPDGRKPEGADATMEELAVPRPILESGFDVTLPSRSRTITLSDPGDEWELMNVACTCSGGVAVAARASEPVALGRLTSYPEPVIPIGDPTAQPGSASCQGSAELTGTVATTAPGTLSSAPGDQVPWLRGPSGQIAAQPGPVIALPKPEAPPPTPPEPPARTPGSISWDKAGTVSISDWDAAGGAFSCVWTVEHVYGQLRLRTVTEPRGRESQFDYRVTSPMPIVQASPRTMSGVAPGNEDKLWKGPWSVELTDPGDAWEVTESECTESDPTTTSTASGAAASVGIDPGDRVACSFTLKLLAPKPGRWRAKNGASRAVCFGFGFRLPAVTDVGTIRVQRDGDRLVARGLSSGSSTTWRLDRGQEDLLRYRGSVRQSLQGARGTFTVDLRLVNEERMVGTFTGKVRIRGAECRINRPLTLTYAGGN